MIDVEETYENRLNRKDNWPTAEIYSDIIAYKQAWGQFEEVKSWHSDEVELTKWDELVDEIRAYITAFEFEHIQKSHDMVVQEISQLKQMQTESWCDTPT